MSNPSEQNKGKRMDAFKMAPADLVIIGHDTNDGPEHPLYDRRVVAMVKAGRAGVASLIDSLLREKQISDVSARKNGDRIEVGVGRRRVYAMRFIVAEALDPKALVRLTYPILNDQQWRDRIIAENLERKDSDAFTEALAFADYVNAASVGELAKLTKLSHKTLDRILALVQMPAEAQALVVEHGIGRDVAVEIAKADTRKQADLLREFLAGDLRTPSTARALAERTAAPTRNAPPKRDPVALRPVSSVELRRAWKALDAGTIATPVPADAAQLLRALKGDMLPSSAPVWLAEILRAMGRS